MDDTLEKLFATILARKAASAAEDSYTAQLFAKGRGRIAQKFGEEAVETVIAALQGPPEKIISESADVLFHLAVLWAECGITPTKVMHELERRSGTSGLTEKANREK